MSDFVVEVDRAVPLRNALVVTAFPTLGNVAAIAAHFLVEVAELKHVGGIHSPRLPPLAAVHEGEPSPPVEVYAGERACGVDGVCESLVVVTSPLRVPPQASHDLAVALLDWSREIGSGELVALEGMMTTRPDAPDLLGVASTPKAREVLERYDVPLLEEGLLGGVSGVLLHRGASWDIDVYGLLARADGKAPDAEAAARLVRAADRVLIRAGFDEGAIEGSVTKIEGGLKTRQAEAQAQVPVADVAYM